MPSAPTAARRRTLMVSSGWAAAAALFAFFGTRGAQDVQPGHTRLGVPGLALPVVAAALLAVVWEWPRQVFVAVAVLAAIYLGWFYPAGPIYLWVVAAAAVLGWREALRPSLWLVVVAAGAVLAIADSLNLDGFGPVRAVLALLAWVLVPVVPWALAALIRMNRASQQQAAAERHRQQIDEERMRIAREVHDVVGHSLAVISMQAGVALHVAERRPDQTRIALEAIARSSRDALAEVRGTLAVFRGDEVPRTPAPGIGDLPALVDDFAATGQPVQLSIDGNHNDVPAPHDLAVYRIVQESLTNTARHAGVVPARVTITRQVTAVVVEISDDGPSDDTPARTAHADGSGLTGMRERCTGLGGSLRAGPRPGGGWLVHAELPYADRR